MDANEYHEFMFKLMYADFCSAVRHEYKNLTSEEQQETNRWLNSDDGKNYFLNKLSRQGSEKETYSGVNKLIDGLDGKMRNMIETGLETTFSKHDWQPVAQKRDLKISKFF